jgi:hypothetical protein
MQRINLQLNRNSVKKQLFFIGSLFDYQLVIIEGQLTLI